MRQSGLKRAIAHNTHPHSKVPQVHVAFWTLNLGGKTLGCHRASRIAQGLFLADSQVSASKPREPGAPGCATLRELRLPSGALESKKHNEESFLNAQAHIHRKVPGVFPAR